MRRATAAELRDALVSALVDIPFMNALPDRRLLINLVRRDVLNFPDVEERADARLHVVEIVLTCLGHPGGLPALKTALLTMAPKAAATTRACELIESATLSSLLSDSENERVFDLLRRAEAQLDGAHDWWSGLDPDVRGLTTGTGPLREAFRQLSAHRSNSRGVPPALILLAHASTHLHGPVSTELRGWVDEQAKLLRVADEIRHGRDGTREEADDLVRSGFTAPGPGTDDTGMQSGESPAGVYFTDKTDNLHSDPTEPGVAAGAGDFAGEAGSEGGASTEIGEMMAPVATSTRSPDRLPQVWGDVPQRNPNFTGRESLLEELYEQLQTTRETAVLPQALHGMGGVGKSQMAIEFVHRHSSEYDLVWWIPSEQNGQILSSLVKLAQRLELNVGPEANSAVPAVREALSTGQVPYRKWLLVFDNAEAPDEVRPFFPTGGAGKILVTSRNADWGRGGRTIEVDVFTRDESIAFLTGRNPDLTTEEADQLADALGDLPLAIEQAAAWRSATGMPVSQYLQLLASKRIELLDAAPSPDYGLSVAAAWNVSLDRLKQINPAALQLLQVCSFFAPEPISRELFVGSPVAPITSELDPILSDPLQLSRAIRDIQRYALARIDHRYNTLQIHRLIQLVLAGSMSPDEQKIMRRGAHTLLANGSPGDPSKRAFWDRYQALRPHVDVSRAVESAELRVQQLVFEMVKFLYYWGDHAGSEALAQEAYDQRVVDRGEADPHTLQLAKWLGFTRFVNGKYAAAKELDERTLELYRTHFPPDDEGTIDAMTTLAADLRSSGDFAGARDLDSRALDTARRAFGLDDPATLQAAHSLGVSLRLVGDYRKAAELDTDTYRRRSVVKGPDDESTLNTANGLIIDLRESGHYLEARRQQEELYQQHLTTFGADAPATLRAAHSLAVARRKAGDHSAAFQLSEDTLERHRRRYDDDFPSTIAAALNYAVDLRHAGDLEAARELGEDVLERYRNLFGARHAHTLSARTNLAIVLRLAGDLNGAYRQDREALETLEATLGPDHPVTLVCATNLASDLYALGEAQSAYERDTNTLARSERVLGVEHPSTLAASVNLALDLRALDRIAEADKILADTMAQFRRVLGERHPATLNALQSVRADCDVDPMLL